MQNESNVIIIANYSLFNKKIRTTYILNKTLN